MKYGIIKAMILMFDNVR